MSHFRREFSTMNDLLEFLKRKDIRPQTFILDFELLKKCKFCGEILNDD